MGAFVHILRCAEGSYYVGCATGDDLTRRIAEHEAGTYGGYTSLRRPIQLVWSEHFDRITDAIAVERRVKGWSRAKKEALIMNDWDSVRRLARRRGGQPRRLDLNAASAGVCSEGRHPSRPSLRDGTSG